MLMHLCFPQAFYSPFNLKRNAIFYSREKHKITLGVIIIILLTFTQNLPIATAALNVFSVVFKDKISTFLF